MARHGIRSPPMGRVIHFEIHAADPDRAHRFYTGVFGWDAPHFGGPMDYSASRARPCGGRRPGGLRTPAPAGGVGVTGATLSRQGEGPPAGAPVSGYVCTI